MNSAALFLWMHPAVWPAALFVIFAPAQALRANRKRQSAQFTKREATVLVIGGVISLFFFVLSVASYLSANTFFDLWESLTGSVAAVFRQGGAVYPSLATAERYATPYGPFLYLTLAAAQWALGATPFVTKIPCAFAAIASLALLFAIVQRQSRSVGIAFVFAGLEAALLLAFRIQAFWPKPDGLILLAITVGLLCVLRAGAVWQLLLGFCVGAAIDLKPHAAAYFLPLFVLALHRGWRPRSLIVVSLAALVTAALPYIAHAQFSLINYLRLLQMTVHEGFSLADALDFLKWVALLAALIVVADHWHRHSDLNDEPSEQRFRFWYRGAILVGLALVAVPGAAVGAGPRHAMPFVPLILYAIAQRFSAGAVRMCGPDRPVWRLIAYCALASCLMVAIQTAGRLTEARAATKLPGEEAETEIRRVLHAHANETILMGAGSDEHAAMSLLRHEVVFAGHPIGIDVASVMDYRKAGVAEPNLFRLVSELRERRGRSVLWILPHGAPFSITNIYDGQPLFSERFRRDFDHAFTLQERTTFFDVYVEKTADEDLAGGHGLGAADAMFR